MPKRPRTIKGRIRWMIMGWMPPRLYASAAPALLPLLNRKRAGHNCRIVNLGGGVYEAAWRDLRWRYAGVHRIDRYLYPDGLERAKSKMLRKYLLDDWPIDSDSLVIEVGANVGEFSVAMADRGARVYAFEPDPGVSDILRYNSNQYPNLTVVDKAAGEFNGNLEFYLSSDNADSSLVKPDSFTDTISVGVVRLDSWMHMRGVEIVNLLKVEAEGYEPEVLRGVGQGIKKIQRVSVDAGPERQGLDTVEETASILRSHGFLVWSTGNMVYGENQALLGQETAIPSLMS